MSDNNQSGAENQQSQQPTPSPEMSSTLNALEGLDVSSETRSQMENLSQGSEPAQSTEGQNSEQSIADTLLQNRNEAASEEAQSEQGTEGSEEASGESESSQPGSTEIDVDTSGSTDEDGDESEDFEDGEDEVVIDNPLVGGKEVFKKKESKVDESKTQNMEEFSSFLKDTHGIENVDDLNSKIETWKGQEQELTQKKGELDNLSNFFGQMDPDLYKLVEAYSQGKNWKEMTNTSSVDYNKDAVEVPKKDLVEAFFPGEITSEDWEQYNDEEGDPATKRLVKSTIQRAEEKFNSKKESIKVESQRQVQKAQENQQLFDSSLEKSKENFMNSFPKATALAGELENDFKKNTLMSVFYNNDGTLKEDAAERLAMAKHGKGLIDQYREQLKREIETKQNQELLQRTPSTPTTSQGSSAVEKKDQVSKEAQAAIDEIRSLI